MTTRVLFKGFDCKFVQVPTIETCTVMNVGRAFIKLPTFHGVIGVVIIRYYMNINDY